MNELIQELRHAIRVLAKSPGFTIVAVLTLAIGIGANTTIFSWINSTLLTPIPGVAQTRSFVTFLMADRNGNTTPPLSYLDYVDLRERTRSFRGLMAYHDEWMSLTGKGQPERIYGAMVSANYFDVIGVTPALGRGFLQQEEQTPGAGAVAIISYSLWQSRFSGDSSAIGKTIEVNRHPLTIVGVAPPTFQGCKSGLRTDLWIPLAMARVLSVQDQLASRDIYWFNAFGRLADGVSRQQAEVEVNVVMQQIAQQHPDTHRDSNRIKLEPLWRSSIGANAVLSIFLPVLIGISGVVLLLACANVSNLLLVRLVARRREIAIRLSIGASRWQLIRHLLIESLVVSMAAGLIAFVATHWTAKTFDRFIPATNVPISINIHVDPIVFWSSMFLAVGAALLFGILPAIRSSHLSPAEVIKEDSGNSSVGLHRSRLLRALVVIQISLSTMLLVCAGLFVRSLNQAQRCDLGFDPSHVLLCSFDLQPLGYNRTNGLQFDRQILAKLESIPGVLSATLADSVPLCFENHTSLVAPDGYVKRSNESMEIGRAYVGPNYLGTLKMPLIAGRDFTDKDTPESMPVAIVNQAFVERYWPGKPPLGQIVQVDGKKATVIGVTKNARWRSVTDWSQPFIFIPVYQSYYPLLVLHVRVAGDPRAFSGSVTKCIHELNPDLPVFDITNLESRVQVANFVFRILSIMTGAFGLIALILAAVGIYSVLAYTTRLRTREVGIRMALGAQRLDVMRLILKQGLALVLAGLTAGLAMAMGATQLLRNQLFGVGSTDGFTYVGVALLLCIVALIACLLPARQAMNLEPVQALRHE